MINMQLDPKVIDILSKISTATLTTILLKKGLRNVWMRGTKPIRSGQPRLVARAFTLRFVPRLSHGLRRSQHAVRSKICQKVASRWSTQWA